MKSGDVGFGGERLVHFLPRVHSFEPYQEYNLMFKKVHPILVALWPIATFFDLRLGEGIAIGTSFASSS